MVKFRLLALGVLLILLSSCAKKTTLPGLVGQPVFITPTLKTPEDSVGCLFKWNFVSKPLESNMDVLSFQPDSRSFSVSFVPDVEGEYEIQFVMTTTEGKEKLKQTYHYLISPDTSTTTSTSAPPPIVIPTTPPTSQTKITTPSGPAPAMTTQASKVAKPKTKVVRSAQKIPKVAGKYTIQVSAWKNIDKAENAQRQLAAANIDAYIQKAYFPETKETWYRVRTGNFDSYEEATTALKALRTKFPKEKFWIDFVRKDQ